MTIVHAALPPRADAARRLIDWPERLAAYLVAHMRAPFAWGTHDCVTFAAGAHEAITGVRIDLPAWASELEAEQEIQRRGGLEAAVDAVLPRVPVAFAQRGDIVLMLDSALSAAPRHWLAVVEDAHAWAPARRGLARRDIIGCALIAWGVGHG